MTPSFYFNHPVMKDECSEQCDFGQFPAQLSPFHSEAEKMPHVPAAQRPGETRETCIGSSLGEAVALWGKASPHRSSTLTPVAITMAFWSASQCHWQWEAGLFVCRPSYRDFSIRGPCSLCNGKEPSS